jgi:hypothetical protein
MRKFPVPWTVEQTSGGHFIVVDAKGFRVAYVYALGGLPFNLTT